MAGLDPMYIHTSLSPPVPLEPFPYPFSRPPKASSQEGTIAEQRPKTMPGFQLKRKPHLSPDEHARMADSSRVSLGGSSSAPSALSREPQGLGLPGKRSEEERAELDRCFEERAQAAAGGGGLRSAEASRGERSTSSEPLGSEEAAAEAEGSKQADVCEEPHAEPQAEPQADVGLLLGLQPRYEVHKDWYAPGRRLAPDEVGYTWNEFLDWYGEEAAERWENAPPDPVAQHNYRRFVMRTIHTRELLRLAMTLTRDTDRLKEQTHKPLPWVFGSTLPGELRGEDAQSGGHHPKCGRGAGGTGEEVAPV